MTATFHMSDSGSVLKITCKKGASVLNLGPATIKKIVMRKPNGTTLLIVDGVLDTDGTDGKINYTFQRGDLNQVGEWRCQVFARFSNTEQWYSSIETFEVAKNLTEIP